jgi:hypothetical protein
MLFSLSIFCSFGLNQFLFFLLTVSSDNINHIDWYIIKFKWFRCCSNKSNKFSSKHLLHFTLFETFPISMFNIGTNYTLVSNKYSNWYNKLWLSICYRFFRPYYGGLYYWYFSFPITTCLKPLNPKLVLLQLITSWCWFGRSNKYY